MKEVVIKPGQTQKNYWSDIWSFRELLVILALRDITVRYKQTSLGVLWAVVRPIITMLVFVFAFHKVAKIQDKSGIDYSVIIFSGILIWNFFATSFQQVSNSITGNSNLISKVYFPRLIMAVASISVALVDFLVGLCVFVVLMMFNGIFPSWNFLLIPFFLIIAALGAFSLGLIFAVLNVRYRDFQQIVPLVIQYGFFVCPVAYSIVSLQENSWFEYYQLLNPIAGIIEGFRWATIPNYPYFHWNTFFTPLVFVIISSVFSLYFFRKKENSFVDHI
ncbi:MAG: ABC transporter permease [Pseudarcicella sp.]|nr:ABC transporter permease [Pseudarcicella sp.]MBP6410305.1 ABC transporter permease [Pseudarcicella sp.]